MNREILGSVQIARIGLNLVFILLILLISSQIFAQKSEEEKKMTDEKKLSLDEMHKYFAIELNNKTWGLLGKKDRTDAENLHMIHIAHGSCAHWLHCGTAVNEQRGEWLISHVYTVLNMPQPAIFHAKRCMLLTQENKLVDFDLAYAYEGIARAYASLGNKEEYQKYIKLARDAGDKIQNKEDKKIFDADFDAEPWFGMK